MKKNTDTIALQQVVSQFWARMFASKVAFTLDAKQSEAKVGNFREFWWLSTPAQNRPTTFINIFEWNKRLLAKFVTGCNLSQVIDDDKFWLFRVRSKRTLKIHGVAVTILAHWTWHKWCITHGMSWCPKYKLPTKSVLPKFHNLDVGTICWFICSTFVFLLIMKKLLKRKPRRKMLANLEKDVVLL